MTEEVSRGAFVRIAHMNAMDLKCLSLKIYATIADVQQLNTEKLMVSFIISNNVIVKCICAIYISVLS